MSEADRLVERMAKRAVDRALRGTIRTLQSPEIGPTPDPPLANLWDDICVQKQLGESPEFWAYE